jgi:hypothetical protein
MSERRDMISRVRIGEALGFGVKTVVDGTFRCRRGVAVGRGVSGLDSVVLIAGTEARDAD